MVFQEHENAADVAKEIRMAVIERRKDLASTKDRHILESIYDVDIIKSNGRICTLGSTLSLDSC